MRRIRGVEEGTAEGTHQQDAADNRLSTSERRFGQLSDQPSSEHRRVLSHLPRCASSIPSSLFAGTFSSTSFTRRIERLRNPLTCLFWGSIPLPPSFPRFGPPSTWQTLSMIGIDSKSRLEYSRQMTRRVSSSRSGSRLPLLESRILSGLASPRLWPPILTSTHSTSLGMSLVELIASLSILCEA